MAYNRATEFTTDHAQIATVLDRFKSAHQSIERRLQGALGGLGGLYGNRRLPASMQAEIDDIFNVPGVSKRDIRIAPTSQDEQTRDDFGKQFARKVAENKANLLGDGLESFLGSIAPTLQDAGSVLAAIEYMRFIEGEKRLIFVTERGFALPRTEADLRVADAASEARVAVDSIVVGGVAAAGAPEESGLTDDRFQRVSALATLKILSDQSGGSRSVSLRPDAAFARINQVTRSRYVVSYHPSDPQADGSFRRIEVSVNRPGASIQVRGGYFAKAAPEVFDRRRVMTDVRIATAAAYPENITDLKVGVKASVASGASAGQTISVSGQVAAERLAWSQSSDGRQRVSIEIAVFCLDEKELLVGEHRQHLTLTMASEAANRARESGLQFNVVVPVSSMPRHVKVVYEPTFDLLGSNTVRLR